MNKHHITHPGARVRGAAHDRPMHPVARRIRQLCDERGLSYAELGRQAGFTTQASQKWFKGESLPSLETRMRIARALNVPFETLLDDEADSDSAESRLTSDDVIERYLSSVVAEDMTAEEKRQLRLSSVWVPGRSPLTMSEVTIMAEFLRMRLRHPEKVQTLSAPRPTRSRTRR